MCSDDSGCSCEGGAGGVRYEVRCECGAGVIAYEESTRGVTYSPGEHLGFAQARVCRLRYGGSDYNTS